MCYDRNDISISERLEITVLHCGTASVERIQGELSSIKVEHVVICKSLSNVNVHLPSCASRTDNFRDCFVAANVKSDQSPVHGDGDGQVFQSASAASANTTAARSPVAMSGSLASSNPSHTNKAIQALSTRKARTAQDVRCRRCKAAASRGLVEVSDFRLERVEIAPRVRRSQNRRRHPFCCLALVDNLIPGAYLLHMIGDEPRERRYSWLEEGLAMVVLMPEQLGPCDDGRRSA